MPASLYLTTVELIALAEGLVPSSVTHKAKAKLEPAEPIAGQTDLYDLLEEPCPRPTPSRDQA
jgi:hypothetical protein